MPTTADCPLPEDAVTPVTVALAVTVKVVKSFGVPVTVAVTRIWPAADGDSRTVFWLRPFTSVMVVGEPSVTALAGLAVQVMPVPAMVATPAASVTFTCSAVARGCPGLAFWPSPPTLVIKPGIDGVTVTKNGEDAQKP